MIPLSTIVKVSLIRNLSPNRSLTYISGPTTKCIPHEKEKGKEEMKEKVTQPEEMQRKEIGLEEMKVESTGVTVVGVEEISFVARDTRPTIITTKTKIDPLLTTGSFLGT